MAIYKGSRDGIRPVKYNPGWSAPRTEGYTTTSGFRLSASPMSARKSKAAIFRVFERNNNSDPQITAE
jgi:hypothetical protein